MAELAEDNRHQVASQTLDAVAREVTASLGEARVALEAYVEQPGNLDLLHRCRSELAQVQGVLRVMEIHGAALLAEEMHQVTRYLQATAGEQKNQAEALDALMRAMVQLPSYLDRVLAGGRDLALVLLPLLNDMRAVRGSPLLSEGTLLLLNLKSEKQPSPEAPAAGEEGISVAQWARRIAFALPAGHDRLDPRRARRAAPGDAGRRGHAASSRSRPRSRCSSCGGWWARWSRRCASADWKAACPSSACWVLPIASSSGCMRWASRATRSIRRSSC